MSPLPERNIPPGTATNLVGREDEQAQLLARLSAAIAGHGGLVLIGGEAGIGKTTLAEDLCHQAEQRGALVLTGRCYDLAETAPYGLWLDLSDHNLALGDPLPELRALSLSGALAGGGQVALFQRVRDLLLGHAARQPLVILLDDLHWADPASLDLLRFLSRSLPAQPVLILATYRSDELAAAPAFARHLAQLAREAHTLRLDLRRLPTESVRALVKHRYRLAEPDATRLSAYLEARAGGNPLFVGEMLRALEEADGLRQVPAGWAVGDLAEVQVPALLRHLIIDRLFRLGKEARDFLRVAAVIGQDVLYALWATTSGSDDETLEGVAERASGLGLLADRSDGRGVRFRHALLREAIYEGIPASQRRRLHRQVGDALLQQPDLDPDAVAYHLRQAGDARAAEWLVRAGERAQRAYAWLTAAERFEAALALLDAGAADPHERTWLLVRLAMMRRYADPQRSIAHLNEAIGGASADPPAALVAATGFYRGVLRCLTGDLAGGLPELADGVAALDALPPEEMDWLLGHWQEGIGDNAIGRRHGQLAIWLAMAGRYGEAVALAGEVVATPPARNRDSELGHADAHYALLRAAAAQGRPAAAQVAFGRARDLYHAAENYAILYSTIGGTLNWVTLPYATDDLAGRERLAQEAERAYAQASGGTAGDAASIIRYRLLFVDGQWSALHQAQVDRHPASDVERSFARNTLALLAREQGQPLLAWRRVREVLPLGAGSAPGEAEFRIASELQRLAASLAVDAGDLATAREWLEGHDRWLDWAGAALGRAEGQLGWAAYHRAVGDHPRAHQHAQRALELATTPRQPLALLAAHRLLGELDTAARRYLDARVHLDAALALAVACAAQYEEALTLLASAELRAASAERAEAATQLERVLAMCEPLEAAPAIARANALAGQLASGPSPNSRPAGLTAREVEVLELVARGMTDTEVAEQLSLSPRTVTTHLTSIYNKLGVSSRAAATRFGVEHGLFAPPTDAGSASFDSGGRRGTIRPRNGDGRRKR